MYPSTTYDGITPHEFHFRVAESQFLRMLSRITGNERIALSAWLKQDGNAPVPINSFNIPTSSPHLSSAFSHNDRARVFSASFNLQITKVQYVINPSLLSEYRKSIKFLKDSRLPFCERLLFHGTTEVEKIATDGFKIGGDRDNNTHMKHGCKLGRGVYLSEDPKLSIHYIKEAIQNHSSRLLLVRVLHTSSCRSVMAEDGQTIQEIVVPQPALLLPCYIVYFKKL